jgi:hypothetical protein
MRFLCLCSIQAQLHSDVSDDVLDAPNLVGFIIDGPNIIAFLIVDLWVATLVDDARSSFARLRAASSDRIELLPILTKRCRLSQR